MAKKTPILRAGILTVKGASLCERVEIAADSEAWFRWLQTSRTFAFDDTSGHFTARKKQRLGVDYWYAFRRCGGRFCELYLGKASDITLARLRATAARFDVLARRSSVSPSEAGASYVRASSRISDVWNHDEHGRQSSPRVTPREREILRLIADGATNVEIARQLVIAYATVKRHVSNILMALNVRNRTQAVSRARVLGLLDILPDRDHSGSAAT